MIFLFVAAAVLANLTVAWFGPGFAVVNAAVLIGLDLTARDRLHERWERRGLVWKMALLIAAAGAVSWLLNPAAGRIALASTVAFMAAATVDSIVYQLLPRRWLLRVNGSNVAGSAVDSVVFPAVAFGSLELTVVHFLAKVAGGFVWSVILRRRR